LTEYDRLNSSNIVRILSNRRKTKSVIIDFNELPVSPLIMSVKNSHLEIYNWYILSYIGADMHNTTVRLIRRGHKVVLKLIESILHIHPPKIITSNLRKNCKID
jgi:hypothetical protein